MPQIRMSYGPARGQRLDPSLLAASVGTDSASAPAISSPQIQAANVGSQTDPNVQFLQSLQTGPNNLPVFQNDAQRILAINSGQYTPGVTPLQSMVATSIANDRKATSDALISHNEAANPLISAKTPDDILAAQLASDKDGTIKKIILDNQPSHIFKWDFDPTTGRADVSPNYLGPNAGIKPYIGTVPPNAHGVDTVAPLDRNIIENPTFAKKYAADPQEGARIYKALTGRDLLTDHKATTDLVQKHQDFERGFFEKQIGNGAKFDPVTNQWQLWQETMPDSSSNVGMSLQAPKAQQAYRPASPLENDIMNRLYPTYDSKGLPKAPVFGKLIQRNAQGVLQKAATDPVLLKLITDRRTAKGSELNPMELLHTGIDYDAQTSSNEATAHPSGAGNLTGYAPGPNTTKGLMKLHDLFTNIVGYKSGTEGDEGQRNAWGSFLDSAADRPKETLLDPILQQLQQAASYGH